MSPIRLTLTGQPPRKSNDRRIVTGPGGRPRSIKSAKAIAWAKAAQLSIPASARQGVGSPTQLLAITFWVRYSSRRPDLSVELILDTLQHAGVIADDRYVFEFHAFKEIDRENPGVDILIEEAQL